MLEFDLARQPYRVLVDPELVIRAREGVRRTRTQTFQQVCLIENVNGSKDLVADPERDVMDQIARAQVEAALRAEQEEGTTG